MIVSWPDYNRLRRFGADVCIIGSGPVGICMALELSARGLRVLVLESGGLHATAEGRHLGRADWVNEETHVPVEDSAARQLGGTSNLWGGRCLPLDPVDFQPRPWLSLPDWPIDATALDPFRARACALLASGRPIYTASAPDVTSDASFRVGSLERWSRAPRLRRLHYRALSRSERILVSLQSTVLGFEYSGAGRIEAVRLHLRGEGSVRLAVPLVVLAAGGNASVRLLLSEQSRHPDLFGGPDGPLGRYYMGHVTGNIADITIKDRTLRDAVDFYEDGHGSYVRRRFTPSEALQADRQLTNIAFWPVVPRISDPGHGSGLLSAVFVGLSLSWIGQALLADVIRERHIGKPPFDRVAHLSNILRDPWGTMSALPRLLWENLIRRPRRPGLFLLNGAGRYALCYHAEHLPDENSRLTLSPVKDALGLPRLRVDLRFQDRDIMPVVRAHSALDEWLRDNALGSLDYHCIEAERPDAIRAQARVGCHQIGTIRMGHDSRDAVVDSNCRSFDLENLYVVSTAVLPTSGQASPTLTAVQLGLRLADHLARKLKPEAPFMAPEDHEETLHLGVAARIELMKRSRHAPG